MNLLFIGDIIAKEGCELVKQMLPELKKKHDIQVVVANAENSSDLKGTTAESADFLLAVGVDILTGGNHTMRHRDFMKYLDNGRINAVRPANYGGEAPGAGFLELDFLRFKLCVVNLLGRVFMDPVDSPFKVMDEILKNVSTPNILVDFHAEATSEKAALAFYLDGRVSAVLGTHTHVQTNDAKILPGGTGFISDVGMVGSELSVIGAEPEMVLRRMKDNLPAKFSTVKTNYRLDYAVIQIDEKQGKCTKIESFFVNDFRTI